MFRLTQGDVTLKPIDSLPEGLELIKEKIVQPSETHGKFHRFSSDSDAFVYNAGEIKQNSEGVQSISPDTQKYVVVGTDGAILFHGTQYDLKPNTETSTDHAALFVPAGIYEISICTEYDYDRMEEARVVD